ncbi:hypothetical protein MFIFM68171_04668 [Madurella fahalii]|uniref:Uncharacterized protein n=1 Tax=Madurella fahalii TaxID=1157608 RepID=A0ABQ0G9L6_9PEZI
MATSLTAATVTTVFTPNPTCFTASSLWTMSVNCVWSDSTPPSQPTLYNPEIRGSAFSDCPVGMTGAATGTGTLLKDVIIISTACYPAAYDFAGPNLSRSTVTYTSGGRTWWFDGQFGDRMCRATDTIQPWLGTTSMAPSGQAPLRFGNTSTLVMALPQPASVPIALPPNTLAPTPTHMGPPSFIYTPPPPHAITQFTPAPSCLAESSLWLVSTQCFLSSTRPEPDASWLECILTEAGDPNVSNRDYHRFSEIATIGTDGLRTYYSACPAGYSPATSRTWGVFNEPTYAYGEPSPTRTYDVTVTNLICCPSGTYDFEYAESLVSHRTSTTVHNGVTHTIQLYPVPECMATSVSALSGKEIPFMSWSETRFWDEKRQETPTITRTWDFAGATLWAPAEHDTYTVFRDAYTCFKSHVCNRYFSERFKDQVPNTLRGELPAVATPGPGTTPTGAPGGAVSSSSTVAASDREWGSASIVVTLVTVVTLVLGMNG